MNYIIHAKYHLIVKLTLFLTILCSLQVSAGAMAQKVDLQVEKESLLTVLQELRKQSGFAFLYK